MARLFDHPAALLPVLVLYLALSLYQIELPGLHYDEAFEAVPALQLLQNRPVTAFRNSGLTISGRFYPLMTQDYIGALNTYITLPVIYLLGPRPIALRLPSILIGGLTLSLTYGLTTGLTGRRVVGLAAAMLLAVDPTFIFWNRQGIFVTAITAPLGLMLAYCGLRRGQTGHIRWSLAGAFCLGLGLYAKLLFVWLIAALAGALILLNLGWLLKNRNSLAGFIRQYGSKKEIGGAIAAVIIGCWPLLLYNLQTGGTFRSLSENAGTSYYGVDNSALGYNLVTRLDQFVALLNSSHLWYLGQIYANPLPGILFGLLLGWVLWLVWRGTSGQPTKMALFPWLVIGLVILASIQTVSALWVTHFAVLMPWPAIAMAVGGWFVWGQITVERWKTLGLGLGLGLLLLSNLTTTLRYHRALTESGGLSTHSDAIYDLTTWLADHTTPTGPPVVAMDWGLAAPIFYLTNGQVAPIEVFGYAWQPDLDLTDRLARFIPEANTFYLWRAPDEVIFDRSDEFKALYRPLALEETIEAAFYERSGRPILGITRLVKCGTQGIESPEPAVHCP
jgi:4-amino-4-deoxy-L-arabinose transferase-like glycosyltransferase